MSLVKLIRCNLLPLQEYSTSSYPYHENQLHPKLGDPTKRGTLQCCHPLSFQSSCPRVIKNKVCHRTEAPSPGCPLDSREHPHLFFFIVCFLYFHLSSLHLPAPPPPRNHHTVVHVHESFFLFDMSNF